MSQRSHMAISGSTAICPCSAAWSEPWSRSSGNSERSSASGSSYHSACVTNSCSGMSSASRSLFTVYQ